MAAAPLILARAVYTVRYLRAPRTMASVFDGTRWSFTDSPTPAQLTASAGRLNSSQEELAAARAELDAAKAELDAAKAELADTQAELTQTKAELAEAKADLAGQATFDGGVLTVRNADGLRVHIDLENMEYSLSDRLGKPLSFTRTNSAGISFCSPTLEIGTPISGLRSCSP